MTVLRGPFPWRASVYASTQNICRLLFCRLPTRRSYMPGYLAQTCSGRSCSSTSVYCPMAPKGPRRRRVSQRCVCSCLQRRVLVTPKAGVARGGGGWQRRSGALLDRRRVPFVACPVDARLAKVVLFVWTPDGGMRHLPASYVGRPS